MTPLTIHLGYPSPPLRSNDRGHWAPRSRRVREVRSRVAWQARAILRERGPICGSVAGPVVVTLVWTVRDHRRRDAGAASPTLKAALDGLVDGGLLADDRHEIVREERCRIDVEPRGVPGVRLVIAPWDGAA